MSNNLVLEESAPQPTIINQKLGSQNLWFPAKEHIAHVLKFGNEG